MSQHASLTPERWSSFTRDQQILMIGNEMSRGLRMLRLSDLAGLHLVYERVLRLVDLTIEIQTAYGLRRELLRWRDLIAELFITPELRTQEHRAAFRALLLLTPMAAQQIPHVLPEVVGS